MPAQHWHNNKSWWRSFHVFFSLLKEFTLILHSFPESSILKIQDFFVICIWWKYYANWTRLLGHSMDLIVCFQALSSFRIQWRVRSGSPSWHGSAGWQDRYWCHAPPCRATSHTYKPNISSFVGKNCIENCAAFIWRREPASYICQVENLKKTPGKYWMSITFCQFYTLCLVLKLENNVWDTQYREYS